MQKQSCLLNSHVITVQLFQYLHLQLRWNYYSLAFMAMPSIMANSCLMGQYFCMSCVMSSFFCGQSFMIHGFSCCRCVSLAVTSYIMCIDVHTDMSSAVSITLMFMLRHHISLSLFSSWLCHDSQSALNSPGLCLYSIHTLYWYMCRIMHCRCCDNVATSLCIIATNSLWLYH